MALDVQDVEGDGSLKISGPRTTAQPELHRTGRRQLATYAAVGAPLMAVVHGQRPQCKRMQWLKRTVLPFRALHLHPIAFTDLYGECFRLDAIPLSPCWRHSAR